jgi:hypothetical protein
MTSYRYITLASVLVLVACGGDATIQPSGGGGTGASAGGSGGTGGGVGGTAGAGGQASGGGGAGGGSGVVCGGLAGDICPDGEFCDYPDNLCGATDGQGVCATIPTMCTEELDPVCGCDGTIHDNPCFSHGAGTDVSNLGNCPVMPGFFTCGPKQCNIASEFCQHVTSDVANEPDSYACTAFADDACQVAVPTCQCVLVETMACGGTCDANGGAITVNCPGG